MTINKKNKQDLKIYVETLNYFRYSQRTVNIYQHYLIGFLNTVDKYSYHIVSDDFKSYLISYNFTSNSQQNQVISAIKFYYDKVLKKKYSKIDFSRPRKESKLPRVIDKQFLLDKIELISNKKHKAIIALPFSTGMRVSEVINLKIEDIDSKRMIIHIKNAKGRKDRIVPLTEKILFILRDYVRKFRPSEYLFQGQSKPKYSETSCNKIVKKYIGANYHYHLLRHSSATAMLEGGTDLRIIQSILGHKNSKTTEIYTHVSNSLLSQVQLPI